MNITDTAAPALSSLPNLALDFMNQNLLIVFCLLALAAFLKYVVPPVPGDTFLLVGIFLVGVKGGSWIAALFCIAAGGAAGAFLAYLWGKRFGHLLYRSRRFSKLTRKVESVLKRWGAWALLLNRFVPYVRTLMYPAAGVLRIPPGRVALAAVFGNILFAILVVALGYTAGRQFSRLQSLYEIYQLYLGVLALFLCVLFALVAYRPFRNGRHAEAPKETEA